MFENCGDVRTLNVHLGVRYWTYASWASFVRLSHPYTVTPLTSHLASSMAEDQSISPLFPFF